MKKVKSLLLSVFLLTGTALLIRAIGISFTAYLSNKIGAVGIGIYQLIMSVYSLAITLATSGIKFTATRLVSEEAGANRSCGVRKAVRSCLLYAFTFSIITALLLFFNANWIGTVWLDDQRTVLSLRLLAIGLPFVAVSAVMNGYFTAVRSSQKGAFIQIADQFIMIIITVMGLNLLLPKGVEYACVALVIGSCVSECFTCVFLGLCYCLEKKNKGEQNKKCPGIFKRMLQIGIPIALSSYARSGLSTIQHLLIPRGLSKSGSSKEEAFSAYGTVHGMVLPLILYPSALMISLAELLVPVLTECQVKGHRKRIDYMSSRTFQLSLLFSVGVMGVLFCFSEELGNGIYHNADAARYIQIFAPLVLIMYMDTVVDGMLKGLGEQLNSMKYNVIDAFCCVVMVYFLIPIYGIRGYIITVMVSEVLNFSLSLNRLIKITNIRLNLFNSLCKPVFCILLSSVFVQFFLKPNSVFGKFFPQTLLLQIPMMILCYVVFLILTSALNKEDTQWLRCILKK